MSSSFARIGDVRQGDVLMPDDGFTCMQARSMHTVGKDNHGLYIMCNEGKHYLSGQEAGHYYIGLFKVGS
jgi:hypothetical protein